MAITLANLAKLLPRYTAIRNERTAAESARDVIDALQRTWEYLASLVPRYLPEGGTAGQALLKLSGSDFDVTWSAAPSAGTTVEVDLGSSLVWRGSFVITDSAITSSSKVVVTQAPGPYTGKGTLADEATMDAIDCVAKPAAGSATVYWRTRGWAQTYRVPYQGNTVQVTAPPVWHTPQVTTWVGNVKGKIKFTYQVLS